MTFSSAFRWANNRMFWKVRAMPMRARRCGLVPVISRPSNRTRPLSGRSTPVMRLNSVVLPAPFGPTTDRTSPAATPKLTAFTACNPPKRRLKRSTSSTAQTTA